MKKTEIEIPEIPDGKRAEWVNGVLTLVDDKPQSITERIKTFEDAYRWCKDNAEVNLVNHYDDWEIYDDTSKDIIAYLKLRIITAALNEGWEPKFEEDEERYSVTYNFVNEMVGFDCEDAWMASSNRMVFKSKDLALYAAKQFRDIYADFCGCKKGGAE